MLTALKIEDNTIVLANQVEKTHGPFNCPECNSFLSLHKGKIKTHHFAHLPPVSCAYGLGESEQHRQCKQELYQNLISVPSLVCELEKKLGASRADLYVEYKSKRYAIEVQLSNFSVREITERTQRYAEMGIYVLWLAQYTEKLLENEYAPKAWEKWVHAAYFGRVYYWQSGLTILPVHFNDYRFSKRWRIPKFGNETTVLDCLPKQRLAWSSKTIDIPDCLLLIDNQKKWWHTN